MTITAEQWGMFLDRERRIVEVTKALVKDNQRLGVTAYVIAGDIVSAEKATELVESGARPEEVVNYIGSYARFDWAVKNLPRAYLFKRLPELWSGSDPDDTNPEYLQLWREAYAANCFGALYDDRCKELPHGVLTLYRGQPEGAPLGISWTRDIGIARKFARSGGLRETIADGVVLKAKVSAGVCMAYITGRGESEVIVDPDDLEGVRPLK